MHVSNESASQIEVRLRNVIRDADFHVFPDVWAFDEFPAADFPESIHVDAIALVRDGDLWSQLVPAASDSSGRELLKVWSFHFPSKSDNSGFVGWLASTIKSSVGSGVAVICGQNSNRGGIFDYWMCPIEVSDAVIEVVTNLRSLAPQES